MADQISMGRLRLLNVVVGLAHLGQAAVILWLSNSFTLPVTGSFLGGPPGGGPGETSLLADLRVGPLVALFLLLAAVDHLLMATPGCAGGTRPTCGAGATWPAGSSTRSAHR